MFKKWMEALPKHKEFKHSDRVCEYHFMKDLIVTTWDHWINGELHKLERGKPRLKAEAVPSLELNINQVFVYIIY